MADPEQAIDESVPAEPINEAAFAALMAPLGPFERAPGLALAVSGGADSMALALLAHRWAKPRGGTVIALTVDHGLRAEAAGEAKQVRRWLAAHGIPHRTLRWQSAKPSSGLQEAARAARYALLTGWCRRAGLLHLLLAHQAEDQAATLLARLAYGAGVDGLAAMPKVGTRDGIRLLRPLLEIPRARLEATLRTFGQLWLDDPSNRNPRFQRVRLNAVQGALAAEGLSVARLVRSAGRLGAARGALDAARAALLVRAVRCLPAGYAVIDGEALQGAPPALVTGLLGAVLATIGGRAQPVDLAAVETLATRLGAGELKRRVTLGGCLIAPWRGGYLVCRERRGAAPGLVLGPGATGLWDGRFLGRAGPGQAVRIEPLKAGALPSAPVARPALTAPPAAARAMLPALHGLDGALTVPHLRYWRPVAGRGASSRRCSDAWFQPRRPLAGASFRH
jgi:tRNA(Ile)-lysidine synthase